MYRPSNAESDRASYTAMGDRAAVNPDNLFYTTRNRRFEPADVRSIGQQQLKFRAENQVCSGAGDLVRHGEFGRRKIMDHGTRPTVVRSAAILKKPSYSPSGSGRKRRISDLLVSRKKLPENRIRKSEKRASAFFAGETALLKTAV